MYRISGHPRVTATTQVSCGSPTRLDEEISMAINDDDITSSGSSGEGPADGGSNPDGQTAEPTAPSN